MFLLLLLVFIVVPVLELSVLIRVGEVLGSWSTVALVLLTAVVGVSLVRSQGLSTLMSAQQKLARGEMPGSELVQGMMLAMAGVLLLIPGFITDFIGLLLLTPLTRKPLAALLLKRIQLTVVSGGPGPHFGKSPFQHKDHQGGQTFDGDFERHDEPRGHLGDDSKRKDQDD
ncbi:FxsA family protein [Shewanella sedimentimangrovi]|uniref:FxsA family protein n=1 Tax=Shewanella sedimentimangrovi TaxID=2814293 RepID=A0ABX7R128_9GAMM|nr:FxsA family protein [Shewanella sedimentimangrovi]QSX36795.1 FxsA family protein [Shewanella sedimentimangrovi]